MCDGIFSGNIWQKEVCFKPLLVYKIFLSTLILLNIKLVKRFKEFYFLGYLYENKYGKIRPFDKVGAVLINLSQVYKSELNHSCIDANISVFYDDFNEEDAWNDLLQYDEKNQTILDNYSKNGVPYISNYRINLTLGERQYANFKSNRQS